MLRIFGFDVYKNKLLFCAIRVLRHSKSVTRIFEVMFAGHQPLLRGAPNYINFLNIYLCVGLLAIFSHRILHLLQ